MPIGAADGSSMLATPPSTKAKVLPFRLGQYVVGLYFRLRTRPLLTIRSRTVSAIRDNLSTNCSWTTSDCLRATKSMLARKSPWPIRAWMRRRMSSCSLRKRTPVGSVQTKSFTEIRKVRIAALRGERGGRLNRDSRACQGWQQTSQGLTQFSCRDFETSRTPGSKSNWPTTQGTLGLVHLERSSPRSLLRRRR